MVSKSQSISDSGGANITETGLLLHRVYTNENSNINKMNVSLFTYEGSLRCSALIYKNMQSFVFNMVITTRITLYIISTSLPF